MCIAFAWHSCTPKQKIMSYFWLSNSKLPSSSMGVTYWYKVCINAMGMVQLPPFPCWNLDVHPQGYLTLLTVYGSKTKDVSMPVQLEMLWIQCILRIPYLGMPNCGFDAPQCVGWDMATRATNCWKSYWLVFQTFIKTLCELTSTLSISSTKHDAYWTCKVPMQANWHIPACICRPSCHAVHSPPKSGPPQLYQHLCRRCWRRIQYGGPVPQPGWTHCGALVPQIIFNL